MIGAGVSGPTVSRLKSIVVVDTDVEFDRRVQRSLEESSPGTCLVDLRGPHAEASRLDLLVVSARMLGIALSGLIRSLGAARTLRPRLSGRTSPGVLSGAAACMRWILRSTRTAAAIRRLTRTGAYERMHAHDLYSGLAAALARGTSQLPLTYDAHELEIHRNRKVGWLRILLEHRLEQYVLDKSAKLLVVNQAIADTMAVWYRLPAQVRVIHNDFYPTRPVATAPADALPAIVYVGMGTQGRQLDLLREAARASGFKVHLYLLGGRLPDHLGREGWATGPVDYEPHLLELAGSSRCMMWCCLARDSLSYELATPNKFFQALALGMPIIASPNTYLAKLVDQHGIGTVLDGTRIDALAPLVTGEPYLAWVENVHRFRSRLEKGEIPI